MSRPYLYTEQIFRGCDLRLRNLFEHQKIPIWLTLWENYLLNGIDSGNTNKLYISWIVNSPSPPRLFVLTTRLTKISKNLADWIRSDLFLFVFSSLSASFTGPLSASKSFENPRGRIRLLLFICCYSSPFEGLLRDALGACLFCRPWIIYFHSFGWIFQNLRTSRYILSVFPVRHFHFHSSRQISQRTFLRAGGTSTSPQ